MAEIGKAWRGEVKLWKVFWIYNLLFGTAIEKLAEQLERLQEQTFFWLLMTVAIPWAIWATVSMWQCAFNANWRGWGYLVRGLIVVCLLAIVFALVTALVG